MRLTWDPAKAEANLAKHGVAFDAAHDVFDLPEQFQLTIYDDEHSIDEDRWITIGLVAQGILLVIYTVRGADDDTYRIISIRRADAAERRMYAEYIAGDPS